MTEQELKRLAIEIAVNTIAESGNKLTAPELLEAAKAIYDFLK